MMMNVIVMAESPHGMKRKKLYLTNAGRIDATITLEIVIQERGAEPPEPTPSRGDSKDRKDKRWSVEQLKKARDQDFTTVIPHSER